MVSRMMRTLSRIGQLRHKGIKGDAYTYDLVQKGTDQQMAQKLIMHSNRYKDAKDSVYLLSSLFSIPEEDINLRFKSNPAKLHQTVSNTHEIINFLKDKEKLSQQQIINGLEVVLFNSNYVKVTWGEMLTKPELQPFDESWRNHVYVVRLLIYFMERKCSFSHYSSFAQ